MPWLTWLPKPVNALKAWVVDFHFIGGLLRDLVSMPDHVQQLWNGVIFGLFALQIG
jgi:hypothetical protein